MPETSPKITPSAEVKLHQAPTQDKSSLERIRDILGSAMMLEILLKEELASSPETPQPTKPGSASSPKPKLSEFPECPPDHWIYTQGPQIDLVRGLPLPTKSRQND